MKYVRIFIYSLIGIGVCGAFGLDYPWMAVPLLIVILMPTYMFLIWAWKSYRFLFMPSPIQLLKGFIRQWDFVRKGPVVTKVSRPRSSPTP